MRNHVLTLFIRLCFQIPNLVQFVQQELFSHQSKSSVTFQIPHTALRDLVGQILHYLSY